jgi:energy-converting hydrogenase A subunit M
MKPIELQGMIESAMAMKREKDITLQACWLWTVFGYGKKVCKQR